MQVIVEQVSDVERRLIITVPANVFDEAYEEQITQFAKKANIKGFRPGKAPLSYIKERFGAEVHRDTLTKIVENSFYQAITEQKLSPINSPKIELKTVDANKPLEFSAQFEVLPEISDIQFHLDNIEKLTVEIEQEDIDRSIQHLCKQYAKWQPVDRPIQQQDRVVIDYHVNSIETNNEEKREGFTLEIGSGVMIPGFENGLLNANKGDEITLDLTYPADFYDKDKANQKVSFTVKVKEVFEGDIPEINDAFVQKLGVASGKQEDLVSEIKRSLEQERNRLLKEKVKEQVFNQLLSLNPIVVPSSLIKQEVKNIHDEIYPPDRPHNHQHNDQEMSVFNSIANKRVSLGLLIAEYVKKTGLTLDKDQLQSRVEEIAASYENPEEVMKWLLSDERRKGIEAQVMEDQVINKLLEGIPEVNKTMSYAELKGIQI